MLVSNIIFLSPPFRRGSGCRFFRNRDQCPQPLRNWLRAHRSLSNRTNALIRSGITCVPDCWAVSRRGLPDHPAGDRAHRQPCDAGLNRVRSGVRLALRDASSATPATSPDRAYRPRTPAPSFFLRSCPSRRPSGLRKTRRESNSLAHRTTWLRSDLSA